MIKVSHLKKKYHGTPAVDDISFEIGRGEIVGFLGPNGAGKTTTIRMLAGYLAMSSGTVEIAGFDIVRNSLEVRRRIGYLPENCPLYMEMKVDEYLRFRAHLKGVERRMVSVRIAEMKSHCGLNGVGHRLIGQLSKGFRQRVGMAEAMLHNPQILLLDEPTVGLDPNQILQMRRLIKDLAKKHTIFISTHILSEAEATCERVFIIKAGKIVLSERTRDISAKIAGGLRVTVELNGDHQEMRRTLGKLEDVRLEHVENCSDGWLRAALRVNDGDVRTEIHKLASSRGWDLRELHLKPSSLEDVFVEFTQKGNLK